MGALQFLNQGTSPSASSNYSQSSTQLPSWYTDYTSQILNKAAQFAAQPYQTYQGPRVAQQSNLTQDAYSAAPAISQTAAGTTQAAGNLIQAGASSNNPLGAAQPYLSAGASDINSSVAPGQGGLSAAQPYLNSAATPTYDTVQNYMNPYNTAVTNAIATAGNTNFNNNTLPALESGIIGSGNITGSSTEGTNLMENAEQQNNQNITNAQAAALQSGYAGSQTAASNAAALQAQLGSTAGALGTAEQSAQQNAGNSLANIGNASGQLNSAGTQNAINAGSALSGVGASGTQQQLATNQNENALGLQNQGYDQSNLNLAYQDYLNQLNYPMTQASAMQGALSGIQIPSAQVNYQYGTGLPSSSQNSPLSTLFGPATNAAASQTGNNNTPPLSTTSPGYLSTSIPTS